VEDYVKLDIPAKAEFVSLGRLALSGLLRSCGRYSEDAVADLKLALTEACSNSVRHAYDHDEGQVHLEFTVHSDRITVLIRDEGGGFHEDDDDCPDCGNLGRFDLAEGGMGISIIRAVVDDFDLRKPSDGGTVLVLTKNCDL
jgi:serine/threonine-protein kinase RsbW